MFDSVPLRVWLLILIGLTALVPARYVLEHIRNSPLQREISQPREDFSWRTPQRFALNLIALCLLGGLALYIFTPAAEEFARSPTFWPILMTAATAFFGNLFARDLARGHVEPLIKGNFGPYNRREHRNRYWASIAWNSSFIAIMIWMAFNMWTNPNWSS